MPSTSPAPQRRSWVDTLGGVPVVTALIGLVGTAIVGNFVAAGVQERTRRNEIALTAFRDNQTAQVALVKETYELIGRYVAAGEDLITITESRFAAANYDEANGARNQAWFSDLRKRHDEIDAQWRTRKYSIGYLLVYHYHGRKEVADGWTALVQAVDAFESCVDEQALKAPGSQSWKERPCRMQVSTVDQRMAQFTGAMQAQTAYLWDDGKGR
jgi:type II secretory pathway pseudopilin PulG